MNNTILKQKKYDFLKVIFGCIALGLLAAFIVTLDGPGWISFISFGVVLFFFLIPITLSLFVFAFVKAIQDKPKQSAVSLICCVVLPVSFFCSIVLLSEFRLTGKDIMWDSKAIETKETNN